MPAGDAPFVSLADFLRERPAAETVPAANPAAGDGWSCLTAPAESPDGEGAAPGAAALCGCGGDVAGAARAARLFSAALADAFEAACAKLTAAFAADVLARELRLERADLAAIVRRLLVERCSDEPLRVRVAAADADIACDIPVVADPRLQPGDAVLECRSGAIDARLPVRIAAVLAAVTP